MSSSPRTGAFLLEGFQMKKFLLFLFAVTGLSLAAETVAERQQRIESRLTEIDYPCTFDNSTQKARIYFAKEKAPRPLLVALHTWSGNYKQNCADYAEYCISNDWNFIFPNFRGPNVTPQACGSEAVVKDILDAVAYMKKQGNVDTDRVYLIGGSGGGFATLLLVSRHPEVWTAASAWCPISDLYAWHDQCAGKNIAYYKHIRQACGGDPATEPKAKYEAIKRSPRTYLNPDIACPVDISTGIRDTLVPISHALNAYNQLVHPADRIRAEDIAYMEKEFKIPEKFGKPEVDPAFGNHKVLFRQQANRARITLFVGGHNILAKTGVEWLSRQHRKKPVDWTPGKAPQKQSSELGR